MVFIRNAFLVVGASITVGYYYPPWAAAWHDFMYWNFLGHAWEEVQEDENFERSREKMDYWNRGTGIGFHLGGSRSRMQRYMWGDIRDLGEEVESYDDVVEQIAAYVAEPQNDMEADPDTTMPAFLRGTPGFAIEMDRRRKVRQELNHRLKSLLPDEREQTIFLDKVRERHGEILKQIRQVQPHLDKIPGSGQMIQDWMEDKKNDFKVRALLQKRDGIKRICQEAGVNLPKLPDISTKYRSSYYKNIIRIADPDGNPTMESWDSGDMQDKFVHGRNKQPLFDRPSTVKGDSSPAGWDLNEESPSNKVWSAYDVGSGSGGRTFESGGSGGRMQSNQWSRNEQENPYSPRAALGAVTHVDPS